tara:strand:+ start:106 stop:279 length:174 start_codon:yes stop_codon:yes gene_type:complete
MDSQRVLNEMADVRRDIGKVRASLSGIYTMLLGITVLIGVNLIATMILGIAVWTNGG